VIFHIKRRPAVFGSAAVVGLPGFAASDHDERHGHEIPAQRAAHRMYNASMESVTTSVASQATRILSAAKEWPLWLFTATALSLFAVVFLPVFADLVSDQTRRWIAAVATAFGIFAVCRFGSVATANIKTYRAGVETRRTFHLTPIAQQCHWGSTRQQDGTITTQIAASFVAKNLSHRMLHLLTVRLIKPKISGEVLTNILLIEDRVSGEYGSAHATGRHIPPDAIRSVAINIILRGVPKQKAGRIRPLAALLSVADAEGNQQRVKVDLRPFDQNATALRAVPGWRRALASIRHVKFWAVVVGVLLTVSPLTRAAETGPMTVADLQEFCTASDEGKQERLSIFHLRSRTGSASRCWCFWGQNAFLYS
jgi:hypothetical protein